MSYPGPIIPDVFGTQDKKDDDGQVIDSLFIETDSPPDLRDAVSLVDAPAVIEIPTCGRILTGNMFLTLAFTSPIQILPRDPNRKSIIFTAFSTAATPAAYAEYVSLADENGKVLTSAAYNVRHGQSPLTFDAYTGAVWIQAATTITAGIELSWSAVTR